MEEKVIEWSEAQREAEAALNKAKTERVSAEIEDFTHAGVGNNQDTSIQTDTQSSITHPQSSDNSSSSGPSGFIPAHNPSQTSVPNVGQSVAIASFLNVGSDILTPMQIQAANSNTVVEERPDVKRTTSFNLADFENEQDPFDNLELKVLDDMEELNKVLSLAPQPEVIHDQTNEAATDNAKFSSDTAVQLDTGQDDQLEEALVAEYNQRSLKDVEYPDIDSLSSYDDSLANDQANSKSDNTNNPTPYSNGEVQVYPQTGALFHNDFNANAFNRLPPIGVSQYGVQPLQYYANSSQGTSVGSQVQNPQLQVSDTSSNSQSGITIYNQHSVGFTTNGYMSHVPQNELANAPSEQANGLRSTRSTPDISGSDERRTSPVMPSSHTPPPISSGSSTPPRRPSIKQVSWFSSF